MRYIVIERALRGEGKATRFVDMIAVPLDFNINELQNKLSELDTGFTCMESDIECYGTPDAVVEYMKRIGDFDPEYPPGTCPECGEDDFEEKDVYVQGQGPVPARVCKACDHAEPVPAKTDP